MAEANDFHRKHCYRLFMCFESLLLLVTILGCAGVLSHILGKWAIWPLALLCAWHVVAIPICFLYLIGKPIVMSMSPLITSFESRQFVRELRGRPVLSDTEFHAKYYEASRIPSETVAQIRRSLLKFDCIFERAIPSDRLYLLDDELDFADLLSPVEREFDFRFTKAEQKAMDGTLGNLIFLVDARLGSLTPRDAGLPGSSKTTERR